MKKNKVYIAGPMTGLPEFNYPAFHCAAVHLRSLGYDVENPAEFPKQSDWDAYMRYAMKRLSDCSELFLLPSWEESKGANIELSFAKSMGMKIHYPAAWAGALTFIPELKINLLSLDTTERLLATLKERADYNGGHIEMHIEDSGIHKKALNNLEHLLNYMRQNPVPLPDENSYSGLTLFGAYKNGWREAAKYIQDCAKDNFEF